MTFAFALIGLSSFTSLAKENQENNSPHNIEEKENPIVLKDGRWYSKETGGTEKDLCTSESGEILANFASSRKSLICFERELKKFRPNKDEFEKGILSMNLRFDCEGKEPINCAIFVKNKDGLWYQSRKIFSLRPGIKTNISVDLSASAKELQAEGHNSVWNCLDSATTTSIGITIFDQFNRAMNVSCAAPQLSGQRRCPELSIVGLNYPENGKRNSTVEARFELSREYFNPFDPDEIKVDVQILSPNFNEILRPAFFTRDYTRELHFNKEIRTPSGKPYWAFRFTPENTGQYKFRIVVKELSNETETTIESSWRTINVMQSTTKGFVRISSDENPYFEFSTGELFFPIGFNIHSVKDLRSEDKLKLGHRPDRGSYSYDEYFDAMSKNGINAVEIWMAAWSFAVEWTSSRTDYYGLGRYNLFNAWRLDHLLEYARKKGIYVHLVLDNHGKLAKKCDTEWNNSPFNKKTDFAFSDDAMLDEPSYFFTDKTAEKYHLRRNRYIAARWGAHPNIFGLEFWSEIDLVENSKKIYDDNSSVEWHKRMSEQLDELATSQLMTTHTCGDFSHTITYRKYYEQVPLISYIVGDAYRDKTPIVEHMRKHSEILKEFKKPFFITEYGGTSQGTSFNKLEADLHGGIWASFFLEHAGAPFLWWHDFIHDKEKYHHFKGFSEFMKGIDPRKKNFIFSTLELQLKDNNNAEEFSCLTTGDKNEYYGWLFKKKYMEEYPDSPEDTEIIDGLFLTLENLNVNAKYLIEFFNTLDGEILSSAPYSSDSEGKIILAIPKFKVDTAFKLKKRIE